MAWPPLRPEAPAPTELASSTTTLRPACASSIAADNPVKPAPRMATSACTRPASGGSAGNGSAEVS